MIVISAKYTVPGDELANCILYHEHDSSAQPLQSIYFVASIVTCELKKRARRQQDSCRQVLKGYIASDLLTC